MGITSRTGLIAGRIKPIQRSLQQNEPPELKTVAKPALFNLKPLSGLYNPYPSSCSLLCNHPTPDLPVPVVKGPDGFHVIPLRNETLDTAQYDQLVDERQQHSGSVPEELFRRYTQTDSRPLTPTPTVASVTTLSAPRRCVTPQPTQRPKLVVDLRRTHSQETLSWTAHSEHSRPRSSNASSHSSTTTTVSAAVPLVQPSPATTPRPKHTKKSAKKDPATDTLQIDVAPFVPVVECTEPPVEDEEDLPRRRGKKKKARSRVGTALKTSDKDPETQIASMGQDNPDDDGTGSQTDELNGEITLEVPDMNKIASNVHADSFLDQTVIKILQRELDQEVIDTEFDKKFMQKKFALQEAFRCLGGRRIPSAKPIGWSTPETDVNLWLTLPRNFSRSSARFDLPVDPDELEKLTPMEYVRDYITVSGPRRLLFNFVFNRNKEDSESNIDRFMHGKNILNGLGEVMGGPLSEKQSNYMLDLLNWADTDMIDFRTWTGICALCERLLASEYCPQFQTNAHDPPNEIERADFETLHRKIYNLDLHPKLVSILTSIRDI